jgi:hypothetical protein
MTLVMLYINYRKVFVVKLKFEFVEDSGPVTLVQILRNFSWDVPVSKQRTCSSVQNILNFFITTSTFDIVSTWQISWFSNFI